jgi:hypothetical protein
MNDWQPMETAPMDKGVPIELRFSCGHTTIAVWDERQWGDWSRCSAFWSDEYAEPIGLCEFIQWRMTPRH